MDVLEAIPVEGDSGNGQQQPSGSASTTSLSSMGSGAGEANNQMKAQMPTPLDVDVLLSSFAHSKHRLIITGLAGLVSRGAALTANQDAAGRTGKAATGDVRSEYEEHAGELWGWQEPSTATGGAPNSAYASDADKSAQKPAEGRDAQSATSTTSSVHKGLPILPPSTGPSRYQSYTQRSRTFAQLPQAGQEHSHGMEEWMEMGDHDDSAADEDGSGNKQPTVEEIKAAIVSLAADPHTTYLLLTSRTREWCDALFASVPQPPGNLWFAAENGYFFKHGHSRYGPDSSEPVWHVMYENVDFSWQSVPILYSHTYSAMQTHAATCLCLHRQVCANVSVHHPVLADFIAGRASCDDVLLREDAALVHPSAGDKHAVALRRCGEDIRQATGARPHLASHWRPAVQHGD